MSAETLIVIVKSGTTGATSIVVVLMPSGVFVGLRLPSMPMRLTFSVMSSITIGFELFILLIIPWIMCYYSPSVLIVLPLTYTTIIISMEEILTFGKKSIRYLGR